jgi:hypothetical protein
MKWLLTLLFLGCVGAVAGEAVTVTVCYNYGCLSQSEVVYADTQLRRVSDLLADARSAGHERALLGVAIGWMLGWAGEQSPISADRGGNLADDEVYGRMDCIDHSTTTTRLLRVLEEREWLHFHRVLDPVKRTHLWLFDHFSAQIAENAPTEEARGAARYVVDSWFVDNGQPAAVMSLEKWLDGGSADDNEP